MRDKSENDIRTYGIYNTAELILRPPERTEWIEKQLKLLMKSVKNTGSGGWHGKKIEQDLSSTYTRAIINT